MYVCMYVCMCMYVCVYIYIYIYIYLPVRGRGTGRQGNEQAGVQAGRRSCGQAGLLSFSAHHNPVRSMSACLSVSLSFLGYPKLEATEGLRHQEDAEAEPRVEHCRRLSPTGHERATYATLRLESDATDSDRQALIALVVPI